MRKSIIKTTIIYLIYSLFIFKLNAQIYCGKVQDYFPSNLDISSINSCSCSKTKGDCFGERVWENGVKYLGSFKDGILHGDGKMTFNKDDSYYEGSFKNGTPDGYGKMTYEDKSKYEGDWKNGKKEGQGAYIFPCGDEYLGAFSQDQINGEGVILLKDGTSYVGFWKNGLAHGEGTFSYGDGNKFIGNFNLGERHGAGTMTFVTEDTLTGNWIEGALDGKSETKFKEGSMVINSWKKGVLEKKVIYQTTKGFRLSGPDKQLAKIIQMSNKDISEQGSSDFSMAWYVVALEYKARNELDNAMMSLEFAQQFDNSILDSPVAELINKELSNVAILKETTRMAKIKASSKSN